MFSISLMFSTFALTQVPNSHHRRFLSENSSPSLVLPSISVQLQGTLSSTRSSTKGSLHLGKKKKNFGGIPTTLGELTPEGKAAARLRRIDSEVER